MTVKNLDELYRALGGRRELNSTGVALLLSVAILAGSGIISCAILEAAK